MTKKTTKEELINVSGHLFRTKSYNGTSIADIARACNLQKASVYHHVSSKQDLCLLVLKKIHQEFREEFFADVYETSEPVEKRLSVLFKKVIEYFAHREGGCLMSNLALELGRSVPEFADVIDAFFADWINAIAYLLEDAYPVERARQLSEDTYARLQGALIMYQLNPDLELIKRIGEDVMTDLKKMKNGQQETSYLN